jgi:hypothetical protein
MLVNMPQNRVQTRKSISRKRKRQLGLISAGAIPVLLLVALAVIVFGGQDTSESDTGQTLNATSQGNGSGPQVAVDRTEVDFGAVGYGQSVDASYTIANVGDELVVLDEPSIKTLEGC